MVVLGLLRIAVALSLGSVAVPAVAAPTSAPEASNRTDPASASDADPSDEGGTISLNPNPASFNAGPLGKISLSGALTGYGHFQSNPVTDDRTARVDFTNLQLIIQKSEGPVQFFIQMGIYSIPSLGALNTDVIDHTMTRNFGPVPLAYGTVELGEGFSLSAGQLTSLFGGEATFTYENLNIVRGLLFNQSNSISRGLQLAYEKDDLTIAGSVTDGFYSGHLTWFLGAISYQLNEYSKLSLSAGTNFAPTGTDTPVAPLLQNSSSMYNLGYNYTAGPWTLTPFVQFTHVSRDISIGIPESASTYSGAFLANYAFTKDLSLSGRVEYIEQSGRPGIGTVSLLYGPGSKAYSVTLTPTWKHDRFFARCEYSFVGTLDAAPGNAFGRSGNKRNQSVFVVETGFLF